MTTIAAKAKPVPYTANTLKAVLDSSCFKHSVYVFTSYNGLKFATTKQIVLYRLNIQSKYAFQKPVGSLAYRTGLYEMEVLKHWRDNS